MTALAGVLPSSSGVFYPEESKESLWGFLFRGSRTGTGTGSAAIIIYEKRIDSDPGIQARASQVEQMPVSVLRRIRRISGLTWDELSKAMNVSRRTLHNWDSGTEVSQRHLQHLHRLAGVLERLDRGNPVYLRNILLKDLGGRDGLAMLGQGQFKEVETILGIGQPTFQALPEIPYEDLRKRLPQGIPITAYENEPTIQPLHGRAIKGLKMPRMKKP